MGLGQIGDLAPNCCLCDGYGRALQLGSLQKDQELPDYLVRLLIALRRVEVLNEANAMLTKRTISSVVLNGARRRMKGFTINL